MGLIFFFHNIHLECTIYANEEGMHTGLSSYEMSYVSKRPADCTFK
jgi:hypothetical protein